MATASTGAKADSTGAIAKSRSDKLRRTKTMITQFLTERLVRTQLGINQMRSSIQAQLQSDRGDVPGWVLVVLMTTGLITAIWTIAAPRLSAILTHSLDSMSNIR